MVQIFLVMMGLLQIGYSATETVATANSNLAKVDPVQVEKKPKFQYTALLDYSSNLHKRGTAKHADSSTLTLIPRWNLSNGQGVSLLGEFTKEYQDEERFDMQTASIIYNLKPAEFTYLKLPMSVRANLPVSEELKDRQGLKVGVAADITPTLNTDAIGWLGWSLSARTRLTRNFHDFTVATSGQSNMEYSLSERIDIGYDITDKWGVSLVAIYAISRTYKGNEKESFSLAQEISYAINKAATVGIGHTNEGGLLEANGDSNVRAFDENSSEVYGYIKLAN